MNITKIEIKNFKILSDLYLRDLKTLNIIAGKNNSGKSSLLEAIFMFFDRLNPGFMIRQQSWRGLKNIRITSKSLYNPLFHNYDISKNISIKINSTKMMMNLVDSTQTSGEEIYSNAIVSNLSKSDLHVVVENNKVIQNSKYIVVNDRIEHKGTIKEKKLLPIVSYISSSNIRLESLVQQFGIIEENDRVDEVIEILKIIEPKLEDLSIIPNGQTPTIYGKISGIPQKIPVSFMGEGVQKLLFIITHIIANSNGIILIDEIENGFHHSLQKDIWKVIVNVAKKNNCQLFVTTHSYELIKSFVKFMIETNFSDVLFARLNNQRLPETYTPEDMSIAIDNNWEIR